MKGFKARERTQYSLLPPPTASLPSASTLLIPKSKSDGGIPCRESGGHTQSQRKRGPWPLFLPSLKQGRKSSPHLGNY